MNKTMKRNIMKGCATAVIALASATAAMAQNAPIGYFLDGFTYRFQQNPAMANSRNFIGMPGVSNFNLGLTGNLHPTDVLYNVNGQTTTFLNPSVSAAEVLGKLPQTARFDVNARVNLFAVGFKGLGGYNTLSISARTNVMTTMPHALFSLLKEGVANKTYDITDFGMRANAFAEIALGHSQQLGSDWRFGFSLKGLIGGASINARFNKATLELGADNWRVTSNAILEASMKDLAFKETVNSRTGHKYVNDIEKINQPGIGGYGAAIDLGVVYKPSAIQGLTVSASVLDLGAIQWNNLLTASTNGDKTFNLDRYTFNTDDNASNSFSNEMDRIKDDLSALYELENMGDQGTKIDKLAMTANVGAQYEMPFWRALSLGLLHTMRIDGDYTSNETRLSVNLAPVKFFSLAASVADGTYGKSFGGMASIHMPGFNLFAGMSHFPTKLSKQYLPLSSNASVNVGFNVLF